MRAFAALAIVVAVNSSAASAPRAGEPTLGPLALYRAARAECGGKPGPRTAQLMRGYFARWLEPNAFGARVLTDWSTLTDAQRVRFAAAADAKLLAPERARRIAAFCDRGDTYGFTRESSDGTRRYVHVMVRHRFAGDTIQIGWVLVEQGSGWTLDRVEVPTADYPGIDDDPIGAGTRTALSDYASAMDSLRR